MNDASNAQTDATQALSDVSNAQADATQALADTSANAANIDEISPPLGIYTGSASDATNSINILIWNDLQYIQGNGVTKLSNGRFNIDGNGFYEMTYGINLETIAGSPVLGVYENANGQLWPSAPEVTSVGTVIVSSDDLSDETNKQFFFRFSGSYVLARAFVTIKRIG